jgi:hypothetical protein
MGHTLSLEFQAIWRILLLGLLLGAGLPAIFALGIRSLALGAGGDAEVHAAGTAGSTGHPVGRVLAAICFLVVILAIVLGITYIVASGFGKTIGFEHVYPTIVDKKK